MNEKNEPVGTEEPRRIESRTPWQILWRKFRRNRAAMTAMWVLVFFYACTLVAGFLAPYHYETQSPDYSFHPPMIGKIHFRDASGRFVRPFVYGIKVTNRFLKGYDGYAEDRTKMYPIRFFVRGDSYNLPSNTFPLLRWDVHLFGTDEGGKLFLLGTDLFGRDILSRIVYGAQISLWVGILGILISMTLGTFLGGISGYYGGKFDFLMMRFVELILAIPGLYFILILRSTLPEGLSSTQMYLLIVVILAFIGWAGQARVIRGMVLSIKEREYVVAAQALGFSRPWIVFKHILPNTLS
ncbi:MAG: ABC transporter permease, partial [Deltaproteobacteria bacterium]